MKKIISFALSAVMTMTVALSASAYADKEWSLVKKVETDDSFKKSYTYYEDFKSTRVGQKPSGFSGVNEAADTHVYVVKGETEDGEKKNMLLMEDMNPSGNVYFTIPIAQKGDKVLVEMKFKFENPDSAETLPFSFKVMSGNTAAVAATDGAANTVDYLYYFSLGGVNLYPVNVNIENGVWYEVQMLVDSVAGTFDAQTKTDQYIGKNTKNPGKFDKELGVSYMPNLALNPAVAHNKMDTLRLESLGNVGQIYFDYIRIKDNATGIEYKGAPPEKIPLPYIGNSVILPNTEVINVVYKNKPVLFTIKPFYEDGTVYAPLRSIGSVYGFTNTFADGVYTLTKGDKVVKVSATEITVDGVKLNAPVKVVSGIYCISIPEFATAMGDKVTFDKDVTIE